jgi:riboflavin synthase
MFTGLIETFGVIDRVSRTDAGLELRIAAPFAADLAEGESVAVNGVCLTVRERDGASFSCAAVGTTVNATTVGGWKAGLRVNLERAMRASDRFGGHIVQGHVDGVARVTRAETEGDALAVDLALPGGLSELTVERGSVAVDGVSLTIAALPSPETIRVSIIEFTRRHTTFQDLKVGDAVNIEADVLAKHVHRLLSHHRNA